MGKSHNIYGICTAAIFVATVGTSFSIGSLEILPVVSALCVLAGTTLPDIDLPDSPRRKKWKTYSILLAILMTLPLICILLGLSGYEIPEFISAFISLLTPFIGLAYVNLFLALQMKHRTYSHSSYVPFLFFVLMWYVTNNISPDIALYINSVLFGVMLGYASHLVFDSCTVSGTPLAYPLGIRVKLLPGFCRIKTNTRGETLFTCLIVLSTITYILWRIYLCIINM